MALQEFQSLGIEFLHVLVDRSVRAVFKDQEFGIANAAFQRFGETGGRDLIVAAPWVAIAPGLALVATVLACTLLGDTLRDRLAGEAGATLRDRA